MASSGDNSKVTADSYGNLYTQDASNECWMLRLPPKLAEAWEQMPEGAALGELVFKKGGKTTENGSATTIKPELRVEVAPHVAEATSIANLPLQYNLAAMTKKLPTLHPFSRHPTNGSVQLHGTVTRTANLQVHQGDNKYRQLLRNRTLQSTVHNSRFVKPVEANQVVQQSSKRSRPYDTSGGGGGGGGFGSAVHQFGQRMIEAAQQQSVASATKKTKYSFDPSQPTKSVVFALFQQNPYWAVKDLKVASGRAESELRDVLREIGLYHRSGDHKNTWSLRQEFQNTQGDTGASVASAAPAGGTDD